MEPPAHRLLCLQSILESLVSCKATSTKFKNLLNPEGFETVRTCFSSKFPSLLFMKFLRTLLEYISLMTLKVIENLLKAETVHNRVKYERPQNEISSVDGPANFHVSKLFFVTTDYFH